ncbi:MAG: HET-C-related protein, partial [Pyrinomonadaceae bacterium]
MYLLHHVVAFTKRHTYAVIVPLVISLTVAAALAFSIPVHRGITKDTLAAITANVNGQPKTFSKRALEQIADANEDVDSIIGGSAALFHPERHFTNESFAASSARLKSLKTQIVAKVTADPPDGDEARELLGQALHTLQDFYAHSNWVELGNTGINTNLGRNEIADPAATLQACPSDPNTLGPNGGGGLTSGYYIGNPFTGCGTLPHAGKCYHGNYTSSCSGINKDKSDQGGPGQHARAVTVATAATKDYVGQILSQIEGNDKAISALLDLKGTLGFVIDDTGSMGEEINGVKDTVTRIVNETRSNPDDQPDNYLLVRFGDPDIGTPFVTQSADALLSAVNALSAHGGGDCPEVSQGGLLRAIDEANANSRLYLFTDASAKDSSLRNEVISRAQEKSTRLSYALTGSCSPIDEAYIRGAAETGGQLFFLNQFEIPRLFDLIKPQLSGDLMTILSTKGVMTSAPRLFDVPVDSTIRRLVVSVSVDSSTSIALRRPSGVVVNPTDSDAQITDIASGRILTINAPGTGTWRVEISGSGNFSVVAEGNSPIEFYRFDFVRPSGDLHGGFAPIPGQPLAGAEGTGEAAMLGSFAATTFKLVSEEGETLKEINLARDVPDAPPDHFVGTFVLPTVPFRVVATGNDSGGFPYQRTFPTVYRAQVVGVEINAGTGDVIQAGRTTAFSF